LERRAWTDVHWVDDGGYSAKDLNRPGIQAALAVLPSQVVDGQAADRRLSGE
jgi:hypothetical protein